MGIYQRGDNWYIDYYVKGRRKRKKIGSSKKLALQVLKDVQVKIVKKEYLGIYEEKKIAFNKYSQQYLEYSKANSHSVLWGQRLVRRPVCVCDFPRQSSTQLRRLPGIPFRHRPGLVSRH